jgi:hypothetical protein
LNACRCTATCHRRRRHALLHLKMGSVVRRPQRSPERGVRRQEAIEQGRVRVDDDDFAANLDYGFDGFRLFARLTL